MSPAPPRLRIVFGVLVLAASAGLGSRLAWPQAPAPDKKNDDAAAVPFKMLPSNHMVVSAKINGEGPFRLVFDLGSPVTLLGNRAAERSGVVKKGAPKAFLFGTRGEATIKSLEMGDLKAKDIPVIVLDHPVVKALGEFGRPL